MKSINVYSPVIAIYNASDYINESVSLGDSEKRMQKVISNYLEYSDLEKTETNFLDSIEDLLIELGIVCELGLDTEDVLKTLLDIESFYNRFKMIFNAENNDELLESNIFGYANHIRVTKDVTGVLAERINRHIDSVDIGSLSHEFYINSNKPYLMLLRLAKNFINDGKNEKDEIRRLKAVNSVISFELKRTKKLNFIKDKDKLVKHITKVYLQIVRRYCRPLDEVRSIMSDLLEIRVFRKQLLEMYSIKDKAELAKNINDIITALSETDKRLVSEGYKITKVDDTAIELYRKKIIKNLI